MKRERPKCPHGYSRENCGICMTDSGAHQVKERASKMDDEEYNFLLGTLAALDVVIISHDQPVIAAEIIRAAGPERVLRAAKRSGYPFMRQLKSVYRCEGLQ